MLRYLTFHLRLRRSPVVLSGGDILLLDFYGLMSFWDLKRVLTRGGGFRLLRTNRSFMAGSHDFSFQDVDYSYVFDDYGCAIIKPDSGGSVLAMLDFLLSTNRFCLAKTKPTY